jgi:hypothetical protein
MTIDEAIKILSILESRSQNYSTMFKKDALKLGIEALKRQKRIRGKKSTTLTYPLPGETEE